MGKEWSDLYVANIRVSYIGAKMARIVFDFIFIVKEDQEAVYTDAVTDLR